MPLYARRHRNPSTIRDRSMACTPAVLHRQAFCAVSIFDTNHRACPIVWISYDVIIQKINGPISMQHSLETQSLADGAARVRKTEVWYVGPLLLFKQRSLVAVSKVCCARGHQWQLFTASATNGVTHNSKKRAISKSVHMPTFRGI
eukprot:SAG31_NODE_3259_length_4484_cov_2.910376_5_plen_145_part_01